MILDKVELANLRIVVDSYPDKALALLADKLTHSMDGINRNLLTFYRAMALVNKGENEQAEIIVHVLLNIASQEQDIHLQSKCYGLLSKIKADNAGDASNYAAQAVELAIKTNDIILIAEAYCISGECHFHLRDYRQAVTMWRRALQLSSKGSNHYLTEKILQYLSEGFYVQRMLKMSEEMLLSALEINKHTCNDENKIAELTNLAILKMTAGNFAEAARLLDEAANLADISRNPILQGAVLANVTALMLEMQNYGKCIEYSLRLKHMLLLDNDPMNNHMKVTCELNLARAYLEKGEMTEAWKELEHAKHSLDCYSTPELILLSQQLNIDLLWAEGKFHQAEVLEKAALKTCRKAKLNSEMIELMEDMAAKFEQQKKISKSLVRLKKIVRAQRKQNAELIKMKQGESVKRTVSNPAFIDAPEKKETSILKTAHLREDGLFIGQSAAAFSIREQIKAVSQSPNTSVIITGESGTGKEIVAQLIHKQSPRDSYPFIAVNSAAIPASLMESELFGYRRGAFTNAYNDTPGIFVRAQHGSVYLDEISEMPYELQAKLLRVLETRKVVPLGGNKEISFDCRIISSSNKNLQTLVNTQSLRLDLYHRLNSFEIHIPPLRDRQEDIPLLFNYYVGRLAANMSLPRPLICNSLIKMLSNYHFPGNVRELINIVERMMVLYPGEKWTAKQLEQMNLFQLSGDKPLVMLIDKHHREEMLEIIEALQKAGGKQKTAARILGISESTLSRRVSQYALQNYTSRGDSGT